LYSLGCDNSKEWGGAHEKRPTLHPHHPAEHRVRRPCVLADAGRLYDLWAGTGTGQGQRPGEGVHQLQWQEDVETFFWAGTPVTITGGNLMACPLARLRDADQEGTHYHRSYGTKRAAYVSEYIFADYPLSPWQRMFQGLVGGFYNRYYLTELEDGSWLCVYFDDYLTLTGGTNILRAISAIPPPRSAGC